MTTKSRVLTLTTLRAAGMDTSSFEKTYGETTFITEDSAPALALALPFDLREAAYYLLSSYAQNKYRAAVAPAASVYDRMTNTAGNSFTKTRRNAQIAFETALTSAVSKYGQDKLTEELILAIDETYFARDEWLESARATRDHAVKQARAAFDTARAHAWARAYIEDGTP